MTDADSGTSTARSCLAAAEELLPRLAPMAVELAAEHCADCRWYHGYWPYFRLLGLATGAEVHAPFFRASLAAWRPSHTPARVLVSGSADHALSALVFDALSPRGRAQIELHVLDRCRTPLALTTHFARLCGKEVEVHHGDILSFEPGCRYDLIVAHGFLGYFDGTERRTLFARWAEALAPGGRLLLVQRLRPRVHGDAVRFTVEEATAFATATAEAAARARLPLGIAPDTLVAAARLYAARKTTHPVADAEVLRNLVREAGLALVHLQVAPSANGIAGAGPSLRSGDDYAHLVATLPPSDAAPAGA